MYAKSNWPKEQKEDEGGSGGVSHSLPYIKLVDTSVSILSSTTPHCVFIVCMNIGSVLNRL